MKEEGKRIQTLIGGNFNAKTREKGGKMSNRIWKEKGWISEWNKGLIVPVMKKENSKKIGE